jgi:transposase-like protein
MTGHGAKFGRKKEAAIAALLTQRNIEEAARTVNVSARTLRRWMQLPEFQAEYLQARQDVVRQTNAPLQQNSGVALSVLLKLTVDPTTPASVRSCNARYIVDRGNKSVEKESWEAIAARMAAYESAQQPEPPVSPSKRKAGPSGRPRTLLEQPTSSEKESECVKI